MAENRMILITLKLDQGEENLDVKNQTGYIGGTGTVSTTGSGVSSGGGLGVGVGVGASKFNSARAAYSALIAPAIAVVSNNVVAWANYIWSMQLTLTDDYVGQRQRSIAMQQINTGVSIATSALSGAAMGSILGPIGSILGAYIGFASSAAEIARSNMQGEDQQNIMLRQMEAELKYTRARVGYSTKAASIGEDL